MGVWADIKELRKEILNLKRRTSIEGGGVVAAPHAAEHSDGGDDEVDVTDLAGYPGGSPRTYLDSDGNFTDPGSGGPHASTHYDGGSDEVDVKQLGGFPGGSPVTYLDSSGVFSTPPGSGGGGAWELAASWTYSVDVTTVEFTGLGSYSEIMVFVRNVTASASVTRFVRVSSDNGTSFYAGASDYPTISHAGVEANASAIVLHGTNSGSARSGIAVISAWNLANIKAVDRINVVNDPVAQFVAQAVAMNAVQVLLSGAGNITGGSIYVFGR